MGITFACRAIDVSDVVKCGLGLSRAEMRVLQACLTLPQFTAAGLAARMGIDRTTVQKAITKLLGKGLITRMQKNRDAGGYQYCYRPLPKAQVRQKVRKIAAAWYAAVDAQLEGWP